MTGSSIAVHPIRGILAIAAAAAIVSACGSGGGKLVSDADAVGDLDAPSDTASDHDTGGDPLPDPDGDSAGDASTDEPIDTAEVEDPAGDPDAAEAIDVPEEDAPATPSMVLVRFPDAEARGLVCGDGSPAGYYVRIGTDTGLWSIHMPGGGGCTTATECDQRAADYPDSMGSASWPASRPGNGILSVSETDNPDFADACHVVVPYCSADFWSGDREASTGTGGWHFRGARILRAAVDALADPSITPHPNLGDATDVLVTGSSAGGVGVLVHLDWVAARLPSASVRGIDDAGWVLDIAPYDPGIDSPAAVMQAGYGFWSATVDETCAASTPGGEGLCYLDGHSYPFVEAPLLVQIAQMDAPQLGLLGLSLPLDMDEREYARSFAQAIVDSLSPVGACFSPLDRTHALLTNDGFWTSEIGGTTCRDVVGNWFFGRAGPTKLIGM